MSGSIWKYVAVAVFGGLTIVGGLAVAVVVKDRILHGKPEEVKGEAKEEAARVSLDSHDIYVDFDFNGKWNNVNYHGMSTKEKIAWLNSVSEKQET